MNRLVTHIKANNYTNDEEVHFLIRVMKYMNAYKVSGFQPRDNDNKLM